MHKTTVYLDDEEVAALRRLAAATGRSQAEIIREAVRQATAAAPKRVFHSMGKGEYTGPPRPLHWDSDELYEKVFNRPPPEK